MNTPLQCSITEMKRDIRLKNKPKAANYGVQTSNPQHEVLTHELRRESMSYSSLF